MAFGLQVIDTVGGDCAPEGRGCARVRLAFPEIQDGGQPAARTARSWVGERILDFPLEEPGSVPAAPRDWIRAFFEDQARFLEDFPEGWGGWFIEREIQVARNDAEVLGLVLRESSYLGGAHPNSAVTFLNVDARTGGVLDLPALVHPDAVEELRRTIESAVRSAWDVPPDGSLEEAGFFEESLPLPVNALLIRDGIAVEYNPYEVAPYVMGAIRALVPWAHVRPLLREPDRWSGEP